MSASSPTITSSTSSFGAAFWEGQWRMSGIVFVVLFLVAYFVYGHQPHIGAAAETVVAFYGGERTRVLIAAAVSGLAVLYLLWFAAAIRAALADAGRDGWGTAATAASAAVGGMLLLLVAMGAAVAYSIAGSGNAAIAAGLNDFAWALVVLTAFPRAMLIMSAAFGFWRAGAISNGLFAVGVAAVVLTLAGGTTWLGEGFWAPDGAYSRLVSPLIGVAWVLVVSRVLARLPAARAGW
jgi:hypothetical protein